MAQPTTILPVAEDLLAETLQLLRPSGTLYCRAELSAPWGIELPAMEGCMMFHVVTSGGYLLEVPGAEPRELRQGSLVLVPHGAGHVMRSEAGAACEPLFDIPVDKISERYEVMHHGGGGELTQVTCGVLRFDHQAAERLIAQLPSVLQIDTWDEDEGSWLQSTLRFLAREAKQLRPGAEAVITSLADILVIQTIRAWLSRAPEADQGWLAALRDPQLGRALAAIHRAPGEDWSVASLAEEARMSRSSFSARFTDLVGESAMRYLTHWRMQLARRQLRDSSDSIATIAGKLGYQSEAAFCRAFRRVFDQSPGSVRK